MSNRTVALSSTTRRTGVRAVWEGVVELVIVGREIRLKLVKSEQLITKKFNYLSTVIY